MLTITTVNVGPLEVNARIIASSETLGAVIIDPGGNVDVLLTALSRKHLTCEQIWLTHSHFDHCGGVAELKEATGSKLFAHRQEGEMRQMVKESCRYFGLSLQGVRDCPEPDAYLDGGEELRFAGKVFKVFHCPGHSPGSLCFYSADLGSVVTGDVLFRGSIGRSDLPGGDYGQLLRSIRVLMEGLPAETQVLPGHGPDTTLEVEKRTNPFLRGEFL